MSDPAIPDITDRLRQEFRVRDWWPGMDAFDSARGETVPHPVAREAAAEIEALRDLLTDIYLYIDWRYVTKQQTAEQKELFANVVEAAGMTADRWWVDSGREAQ